jgi:hypothetical protein
MTDLLPQILVELRAIRMILEARYVTPPPATLQKAMTVEHEPLQKPVDIPFKRG